MARPLRALMPLRRLSGSLSFLTERGRVVRAQLLPALKSANRSLCRLLQGRRRLRFPLRPRFVRAVPLFLFCVVLVVAWVLVAAPTRRKRSRPPRAVTRAALPLVGVTVLLDPGHGGLDSGAIVRWSAIPGVPATPAVPAKAATPAQPARAAQPAVPAKNGKSAIPARPAVGARAAQPAQPARPALPGRAEVPGGRAREDALNYRFAATLARVLRAQGANVRFTVTSEALQVVLREGKPEPSLRIPDDACAIVSGALLKGTPTYLWQRGQAGLPLWQAWQARPIRQTVGRGLYFLSLHHDKVSSRQVRGARICCDVRAGDVPVFARTLARTLAQAGVAQTNSSGDGRLDGRHLGVLNPKYNPIEQKALLEIATLSNRRDRVNALSPTWRWRTARLIARAIRDCERLR